MKTFLILFTMLSLILINSARSNTQPEKPLAPYIAQTRAVEIEPNNDFNTATVWSGDDMSAEIQPAGDVDYFAYTAFEGECLFFITHPGNVEDTVLYIYGPDGQTELAFDDNSGEGLYSRLEYRFWNAGTYYIKVAGYDAEFTEGTYVLTTFQCSTQPYCDDAIDLQAQGLEQFTVDLCLHNSYLSGQSGDCTGYVDHGNEATYKIYLAAGETFNVTQDGSHDMSLYLVTDCWDLVGTCVAGSDNCCSGAQEIITYTTEVQGWYFLIVDGYSGCSEVTVTISDPVAAETATWSGLKSLYQR